MNPSAQTLTALADVWGYGEADPIVLGIVIAAFVCFAVVYVARRILAQRKASSAPPRSRR